MTYIGSVFLNVPIQVVRSDDVRLSS